MFHQNLADALAFKRHMTGEHFVQNDAQSVDIDFFAIAPVGDFGRHVVHRAHAAGLPAATAARNEFRQAVIADFDDALIDKNVSRLQVAMHNAVVVQVGHAGRYAVNPCQRLAYWQAVGIFCQQIFERVARHQLHDHPSISLVVLPHVVQREQVRVLEIQAVHYAAQLDIQIAANEL